MKLKSTLLINGKQETVITELKEFNPTPNQRQNKWAKSYLLNKYNSSINRVIESALKSIYGSEL